MEKKLLTPELRKTLEADGYTHLIDVPGRGVCGIYKFIFTTGLCWGIDEYGYRGRYCYANTKVAILALADWSRTGGENDPLGPWLKYKGENGERSNPNANE